MYSPEINTEDFQTSLDELIKSNNFVNCLDALIHADGLIAELEKESRVIRNKITEIKERRKKTELAAMYAFFWKDGSSFDIGEEEDIYHNGYLISIDTDGDCTTNIVTKPIRSLNEIKVEVSEAKEQEDLIL